MKTTVRAIAWLALLAGSSPPIAAQIANYGAAQLARQAVDIRAPYLAQMAQLRYQQQTKSTPSPGTRRSAAQTTFTRSANWFKPWSMANEIAKKVEWDPKAPFGTGFAREEAQRQALTKLFTGCLEAYETAAKAEGLLTNDLAVTYGHTVALNTEISTGRRMPASDEAALRQKLKDDLTRSTQYWTDADKQAVHETIVISTMLAVAGYANATRDNDARAQEMFRNTAQQNITALTSASLIDLRNARSALSAN